MDDISTLVGRSHADIATSYQILELEALEGPI